MKTLSICQDVTPEAVEALLADQDGVAWPIFVDGSRKAFQQVGGNGMKPPVGDVFSYF